MTKLLLKLFIKDYKNIQDNTVREKYGVLGGAVGIVLNIILAAAKLIIGSFSGSISITADAVNNFSDAGSSIITLIGFKMSNKPADTTHPFGHGRIEYISGLIVGFIVLLFGFDFIKTSVEKIINPTDITYSIWVIIVLVLSILGKIWLGLFNRNLGQKINSTAMTAVFTDCISDCGATLVTIISMLLSRYAGLNVDGILGIVVAVIILIAGINIVKDTINPLLGQPPEEELVKGIEKLIMSYDKVVGIHDLIIHNYGSAKTFGSVHVEVPANENVLVVHEIMDDIEVAIKKDFGIEIVAHTDPIETDNKIVTQNRKEIIEITRNIDDKLSIHDFRLVSGPNHTNLIFDVVLPYDSKMAEKELVDKIKNKVKENKPNFNCVITVDRNYSGN
ncbi:MAG: cation transporter [Ruminococcaceae bacterium]|nr:cation transporter [Oscillospiraceae bacterium]